ncbi:IclR family transcriptional regulator [Natrialba sp. PRR66]|uniref:IclR family transcriptional regulator n=1 Tax=Natrialba sp. PRR66 TaxID=3098146 RepID=UPI002B1DC497|nr:IclR family transcriptional regulator [Natrialba sp. PRR66]
MTTDGTSTMTSVLRAFDIITVLWEVKRAGPSEIATRMSIPKSTAHVYLRTLAETGYVVNDGGEYSLSYRFLMTGSRIKHRNSLFRVSEQLLGELAAETDELVTLVVEQHDETVILHTERGDRSLELGLYSGMTTPLHTNATGKAILAQLPDERVDEIIETQGLEPVTEQTITDESVLRSELADIRDAGYAVDWNQQVVGMGLVGIPISIDEQVAGAVGIVTPTERVKNEEYRQTLIQKLQETVDSITIKYRYGH